jgi:hypothetical protein
MELVDVVVDHVDLYYMSSSESVYEFDSNRWSPVALAKTS